jgi:type IV pilus assembly protein PilC
MPTFQWEGKTRDGSVKRGAMVADSSEAVMMQLRQQSIMATRVKAQPKDISEYIPLLKTRVKAKDVVIFTRQFATMIDAGLPLVQCLDILGSQQENKAFKKIIMTVKSDVESGSTFSS